MGILRGSDPVAGKDAILLTAHLDHLGIGPAKNGDRIYNGADDDASGTTAVIELARVFAGAARPARTLLFVLFGSEEIGGYGNRYFLDHPPVPLDRIVANLEFEMIGRRDPALPRDGLWLTGFERSDLGPELVRHGAALVADPHPEQNFFQRSDNYSLARRGIIAQTVSSFGLHADYHQPSDEISRIDFPHMTRAIGSMVEPIEWLAQTAWKPQWLPRKLSKADLQCFGLRPLGQSARHRSAAALSVCPLTCASCFSRYSTPTEMANSFCDTPPKRVRR